MKTIKTIGSQRLITVAVGVCMLGATASAAAAPTEAEFEALKKQIEQQQKMLEQMQRELQAQKQQKTSAGTTMTAAAPAEDKTVVSGLSNVKLSVSGQINRMVNIADDGDDTKTFFVDNDNSNSRIRFVGTADVTDDLTLGTKLEFSVAPDESSEVSQDNESSGDFFSQRWTDISLNSKRYGTVYLGKGDTASNNTSEVDLSKTGVIQYSSVADTAGGLQFKDQADSLTGVTLSDAFKNQDGLSRQSRLRYDTPVWNGFNFATSAVTDQRWDAAINWSGKIAGLSAGGAVAVSDPRESNDDLRYNGSFSVLHDESGLNLTVAGGLYEQDVGDDEKFYYAKLGWIAKFFNVGTTAFGVDWHRSQNVISDDQDADSYSIAAVQSFNDYGTELYALFRSYSLDDAGGVDYQDINVGTVGARVKF